MGVSLLKKRSTRSQYGLWRVFLVPLISAVLLSACIKAQPLLVPLNSSEAAITQDDVSAETTSSQDNDSDLKPESQHSDEAPSEKVRPPLNADQVTSLFQRFELGVRLLEKNELVAARVLFEDLVEAHPDISLFQSNLGVSYRRLGMNDEALVSYQKAIALAEERSESDYPEHQYNLAILLRERGDFKAAEAAYRAALSVDPDFQDAHYNLAVLYDLYLNQPAAAIAHYKRHMILSEEKNEVMEIWIAGLEKRIAQSSGGTP